MTVYQETNYARKIIMALLSTLLLLSSLLIASQKANAAPADITNNSNWNDTDGNPIWAQGGYIIQQGNTFYWYGMDYSVSGVKNVNLYTSTDMKTWANHGNVVNLSSIPGYAGTHWIGRPVVAYNSSTAKYVMLLEWNNSDGNGRNKLTYFTSSSITGPFTYERFDAYPSGSSMGDLGSIFQDGDGSTYITYTSDNPGTNGAIQISKLASDYLSIAANTKWLPSTYPNKEASTLIKRGSQYLLFTSATNGWYSSQTYCSTAASLSGTWSTASVCSTSPSTTNSFDTQVDQVLPIVGTSGTMYVYLGDRWNNKGGSTGVGRNQWYPISFDGAGVPTINGYGQWRIDTATGTWSPIVDVDVTKTYSIGNRNSGKVLGIVSDSTADGGKIEQRSYSAAASQTWQFINAGSGLYKIKNVNSLKLMDITGASLADGAQNIQWTPNNGTNQLWQLISVGSGYFKIKNQNSGKFLGISAGSTADGGLNIQWADTGSLNQNWSFTER
ncbi:RICIN domain-containing protein [Paenibacillus alba]|uniref:RICIN domain-containing protein n=1 Tax=Paenibacillus alba TaxID=1197127 RepID=A0ABU6G9Q1_9BACL|nr:RICIN domain-containing protein [Paenibacillus alba]MEC0229543.1 RICIN domain-containing protein [Paenibacillus alba]